MEEMKSFVFANIPRIHFGVGSFASLADIVSQFGTRVVLICGRSFSSFPPFNGFLEQLHRKEITAEFFTLTGEPSPQYVDQIVGQVSKRHPACVVAIGGGSVIDAGKAVSAMIPAGEAVGDFLEGIGTRQHDGQKIPFIAVPTTAGTGSEATKNAVLSENGPEGYKKSLRHDHFVPDVAIVDPELTLSCPPEVTMAVGMDAFTQLLEAFTSTNASVITDLLALEGLSHAVRSLPVIFEDPGNLEARTGMSYAALLSGITLANAGLGVVHGFASVIGGMFPAPHGVVCGALLSPATRANIQKLVTTGENPDAIQKYGNVGQLFSTEPLSSENRLELLGNRLHDWTRIFRIPKLSTYGVTRSDIDLIVAKTSQKNNPVKLESFALRKVLEEAL